MSSDAIAVPPTRGPSRLWGARAASRLWWRVRVRGGWVVRWGSVSVLRGRSQRWYLTDGADTIGV